MSGPAQAVGRARGEPLLALALICAGWLGLRVLLWEPPFGDESFAASPSFAGVLTPFAGPRKTTPDRPGRPAIPGPQEAPLAEPPPAPWHAAPSLPPAPPALAERPIVGQEVLLAAAFAHMDIEPQIAGYVAARDLAAKAANALGGEQALLGSPAPHPPGAGGRWAGDAWVLARGGSVGSAAAIRPTYGRSQAGAVLRYRVAPASGHRPIVYARAVRSLAGQRETEVAAGLAGRPIAGVPLRLAAEVRLREGPGGRELRPAAFAVTELPPADLPLGLRTEGYAQAGYVGGRFASAFVDGQARIDASLARLGREGEVRLGGAIWGGAQRHAGRLDVGPSAAIALPIGRTQSRVAVDYRFRIAGDAAPASGPALTISAGF